VLRQLCRAADQKAWPASSDVVLRTIVESTGNESELIADVIGAISDLVRAHPRWVNLGLAFIEAFDKISLAQVRKTARATGVQPLRDAIMTLLCVELEKILGPSRPPKSPVRSQAEVMRYHLALGVALLKLKQDEPERSVPLRMNSLRSVRRAPQRIGRWLPRGSTLTNRKSPPRSHGALCARYPLHRCLQPSGGSSRP